VTKALTAAGGLSSPYRAGAIFEINAELSSKFETARRSLKACFESYEVRSPVPTLRTDRTNPRTKLESWATYEAQIEAARNSDEIRLNELVQRLGKVRHPICCTFVALILYRHQRAIH
jgi:hypothetical protein